jgi:hypothetical protein
MLEHREDAFDGYEPESKPKLIFPVSLWAGGLLALILGLAALTTGCAAERYLTDEQDAKMREICSTAGCEVVPTPLWQQIEIILRRIGMPLT